jgi:hypothetical protein
LVLNYFFGACTWFALSFGTLCMSTIALCQRTAASSQSSFVSAVLATYAASEALAKPASNVSTTGEVASTGVGEKDCEGTTAVDVCFEQLLNVSKAKTAGMTAQRKSFMV